MDTNSDHSRAAWGVKVNSGIRSFQVKDYPAWANPRHREKWNEPGVVLWSDEQQQVTHLRGGHALKILDELRANNDWREQGVTVGEPVVRIVLPNTERKRRRKGQPTPEEPPKSKPENVLVNTMALTGEQTQYLFDALQAHEDDLRHLADADEKAKSEALGKAYDLLFSHARVKEAKEIDLATRPVPWTLDEKARTLTCDMPPNRVTLTPIINSFFWQGCLERPGKLKRHSPHFVKLDEALTWAEQEIIEATEEAAQPEAEPAEDECFSLDTLTVEQREHLAPFWIEPAALEPKRLTYRVCIRLRHNHIDAKTMELSFGEKMYYSQKYPTVLQIAQKFHFNGDLVDIEDMGVQGIFHVDSRTTYLDRLSAIQEAKRLWENSTLSSARWSQALEWAYFGVQEKETGYLDIIGGIGKWGREPEARDMYMSRQALSTSIAYALNIDYWRAMMGRYNSDFSDQDILEIMHHRRARSSAIPKSAREESRRWLDAHRTK